MNNGYIYFALIKPYTQFIPSIYLCRLLCFIPVYDFFLLLLSMSFCSSVMDLELAELRQQVTIAQVISDDVSCQGGNTN